MGAIQNLSTASTVTASTTFAVNQSGQDVQATASAVRTFMQDGMTVTDDKVTQYASPSASSFTVAIDYSTEGQSIWLVLTPTAGFAVGAITLPPATSAADNQEVMVNCTQAVTTLTVSSTGASVTGAPTTLAANAYFRMRYNTVNTTWYRVG